MSPFIAPAVDADRRALVHQMLDRPRPDAVFNLFEGFHGTGTGEAAVAGLMDLLGWSYTGSPADCLELVRDKARTKWLLAGAELPTPRSYKLTHAGLPQSGYEALLETGP